MLRTKKDVIQKMLGHELGRGSAGTVYTLKDDASICVKMSQKNVQCRTWADEFMKLSVIHQRLEANGLKTHNLVNIIRPERFGKIQNESGRELHSQCIMFMPCITPWNNEPYGIHPMFGMQSGKLRHWGRGLYVSLDILINTYKMTRKWIDEAVRSLGHMMAELHYFAQVDAYNVQILLGKNGKLTLIDFDQVKDVDYTAADDERDAFIERVAWSLGALPYFPSKQSDEDLYKLFFTSYLNTARKAGPVMLAFAKDVKEVYDDRNLVPDT